MQKESRVFEDPLVQRAMQVYHAIDDHATNRAAAGNGGESRSGSWR